MQSEELYKEAYSRHHDNLDLEGARQLYEELLARFPDSEEARGAKAQLMAIQRTTAPPPLPSPSATTPPSPSAPRAAVEPPRTRSNWFPWTLAVIASCVATWAFASSGVGGRPSWEFDVEFFDDLSLERELSQRGSAGWEIATCRRASSRSDDFGYECIMQRSK